MQPSNTYSNFDNIIMRRIIIKMLYMYNLVVVFNTSYLSCLYYVLQQLLLEHDAFIARARPIKF